MVGAQDTPAAEVEIDERLVRELLREQQPDLADLTITPLASGWDNTIFRLGDELLVRLPRRQLSAVLVEHEQRWLPVLAPRLPLPIPVALRDGRPSPSYPWAWSVCRWFPGTVAAMTPLGHDESGALVLGEFVRAMNQPAPPDAPENPYRGVPLADRDEVMRERVGQLGGLLDAPAVTARWEEALALPPWSGPALWLHGDLHPANLLVHRGRFSAVIDFGDLTSGDPATDLAVAWMLFPAFLRAAFRRAAGEVDDDTWARARGWALSLGVAFLAHSADNPRFMDLARRTIHAALTD
jgi:aminoglycoside phosphotransferase (APT) family kinase protein